MDGRDLFPGPGNGDEPDQTAFRIPTGAMLPTLEVGDYIMTRPLGDLAQVRQGDVVVFKYPENHKVDYVKRCVAVRWSRLGKKVR